jgi:hypothetical protein
MYLGIRSREKRLENLYYAQPELRCGVARIRSPTLAAVARPSLMMARERISSSQTRNMLARYVRLVTVNQGTPVDESKLHALAKLDGSGLK